MSSNCANFAHEEIIYAKRRSQFKVFLILFSTFFKYRRHLNNYLALLTLALGCFFIYPIVPPDPRYSAQLLENEEFTKIMQVEKCTLNSNPITYINAFLPVNDTYFICPDNNYSHDLISAIFPTYSRGKNDECVKNEWKIQYFQDIMSLKDKIYYIPERSQPNEPTTLGIWCRNLDTDNPSITVVGKTIPEYSIHQINAAIFQYNLLKNDINISFTIRSHEMDPPPESKIPDKIFLCFLAFYISFGFLFYLSGYFWLELHEQKIVLLLKISGAHEFTIILSYFMTDTILSIIFAIFTGSVMSQSDFFIGVNPFLLIVLCFIHVLALISQYLCFLFLFKRSNFFKYFIIILFIVNISLSIYSQFEFFEPTNRNENLVNLAFLISPQTSFIIIIQNIVAALQLRNYFTYTWKDLNTVIYTLKPSRAFYFQIYSFIFYTVLYIINDLMMPRADGSPPIGWINLFRSSFWKKLIKKFKHIKNLFPGSINRNFAPGEELFAVSNLEKIYHGSLDVHALQGVSFSVKSGEIDILIGPNGCGKSTLINTVSGTIQAESGSLRLFGQEAIDFSEIEDYIGVCFQDNIYFPMMTVEEHLKLFALLRGVPSDLVQDTISRFGEEFDLELTFQTWAKDLSGGQKRKLSIAMALIGEPLIAFLDEPTASIDTTARGLIWKTVSHLNHTTLFVSSHDLEEAESISTNIFVMASGKFLFSGTAADLRQQYHCGYIFKAVGEHPDMERILNALKKVVPDAVFDENKEKTIMIPTDDTEKIALALAEIDPFIDELMLENYTLNAESLEGVILRMVSNS